MESIRSVSSFLESLAPLNTQESYDNCGLITGSPSDSVTGIVVSLDCTEDVVQDAIDNGCNLIVSHHPIVFKGLKKLNGSNYVERTIIKAIKNDIAIYALHTNLDHYRYGVNYEIGKRIGLKNLKILDAKTNILNKLVCYVPATHEKEVRKALFDAGAGSIGDYSNCSFSTKGMGTYTPGDESNPFEGVKGEMSTVDEVRVDVVIESHLLGAVLSSMNAVHPYEEVAYEVYQMLNKNQHVGSGMVGELESPMSGVDFLKHLKDTFNLEVIRHTDLLSEPIKKVAFCGGAGSFLLSKAKSVKADIFVTGDYKYHEFFDAEDDIVIADIGHFESEQFTSNRISELLTEKFPKFAVRLTEVNTNPINYF